MNEKVSRDGLRVRVGHHHNPYRYLLADDELDALLLDLGLRRAASIWAGHKAAAESASRGVYRRPCMAFVLMDPTAETWVPDEQAVMAVVVVGDEGARFLPNAAAKAAGHRRLGRNYGEAVLVDTHLCGTGHFRHGHSAEVRGLIVGSSAQTTDQDLFEAGALATDFVDAITERHLIWQVKTGPGDWLNSEDVPGDEQRALVGWFLD